MDNSFVREIEVYENERYIPLSGWSTKGLLMTDRSAYSNEDGSANFGSLEEAGTQLTSEGWSFKAECNWTVDFSRENTDEAGWGYATDFGGTDDTFMAEKGIASFVRRRKLLRFQTFNPDFLCSDMEKMTCDNADLELVGVLSKALLNAVLGNSMKKHPRQISEPKIAVLKNTLMSALNLKGNAIGVQQVFQALEVFSSEGSSAFSVMSAAVSQSNSIELIGKRFQQLDSLYFPMGEREALARSIVRKHDREHLYHCAKQHCGEECTFRAVTCLNPNCHVVISACWVEKHDKVCPRKIVPCDRACGESLARMSMEAHREHSCPLRPVLCPFSVFGCMTELVAKNLSDHMDTCTQSHLLLSLNRIVEHQHVMLNLKSSMTGLEIQCVNQSRQITVLTSALTAAAAADVVEKKAQKQLFEESTKLAQKQSKKCDDSIAEIQKEITKNSKALSEMITREKEREKEKEKMVLKK